MLLVGFQSYILRGEFTLNKVALALAAAGALGLSATAIPLPAQAQPWVGPAVVGGLAAGALIGASSAYAWGPYGYGGYTPAYYGAGYAPTYFGSGYAYDYDAPTAYTTTYY